MSGQEQGDMPDPPHARAGALPGAPGDGPPAPRPGRRRSGGPAPDAAGPAGGDPAPGVYVVDRIEGDVAVLVADAGGVTDVPARTLPPSAAAEGAVLRVPAAADGAPDWAAAARDTAEETRRRTDRGARAARLLETDPGGDVAL